jgi:hypothetical protein
LVRRKNEKKIFQKILFFYVFIFSIFLSPVFSEEISIGPANGGFEYSLNGWSNIIGNVSLSTTSYSGTHACLIKGYTLGVNIINNGGFENYFDNEWQGWSIEDSGIICSNDSHSGSRACLIEGFYIGPNIIYNGGFENGLNGWSNKQGNVILSNDSNSGSYACQITGESSAISSIDSSVIENINPGNMYTLSSYVKYLSGNGKYKVTIEWLDINGGHISYSNDWAGSNKPSNYSYHGGIFKAPSSAKRVKIMIGVKPGVKVLFDDIKLCIANEIESGISSFIIQNIRPGQLYKLGAYVKYLSGNGKYKVTIEWLDINGGHISYSNDWEGTDKPASYTKHGHHLHLGLSGSEGFLPPEDARKASIILGVEPGVEVLFDEITLSTFDCPEELYLSNGLIKVGVKRKYGGAIFYLADNDNLSRNFINYKDAGKLVQHSYWGLSYEDEPQISNEPPWNNFPWNPVQGGNQKFNPEIGDWINPGGGIIKRVGNTIYTECYPLSWNQDLRTKTRMKTEVTLPSGSRAVKIVTVFDNRDPRNRVKPNQSQELICAYVTPDLKWFKTYYKDYPFTSDDLTDDPINPNNVIIPLEDKTPCGGDVNHHHFIPREYWGAWVNDSNFGVGLFCPELKKYQDQGKTIPADAWRVADGENNQYYDDPNPLGDDTNYLGLWAKYPIEENMHINETSYVILDSVENIRNFVYEKMGYPTVSKQITVTSPNGGESWLVGSNQNITWTSTGIGGNVKIEYSTDNGTNYTSIVESTENDDIYEWTIPDSVSSNCLVHISETDGEPSDVCDEVFSVFTPSIIITSPNGGEALKIETSYNITWSSLGLVSNIRLRLFKNSSEIGIIAEDIPISSESYFWTVGSYQGGMVQAGIGYVIKIETMEGYYATDESDSSFEIINWVDITSPNEGEDWPLGLTRDIVWNSGGGITSDIKLILIRWKPGGTGNEL